MSTTSLRFAHRPSRLAALAGAFALASTLPLAADAAVDVYTLPPAATFKEVSAVRNIPGDPGFTWSVDNDEQAWVYFKLAAPVSFDRITWYGSAADNAFAVGLFTATCGSCQLTTVRTDGSIQHNLLPHNSSHPASDVAVSALGNGVFAYTLDLPSTITLDGSSPWYALTVVNNFVSQPFQWSATSATTGTPVTYRYIVGLAMVQGLGGGMAFTLTDRSAAPVPEPATAALWAAGLGIGLLAHRRLRG